MSDRLKSLMSEKNDSDTAPHDTVELEQNIQRLDSEVQQSLVSAICEQNEEDHRLTASQESLVAGMIVMGISAIIGAIIAFIANFIAGLFSPKNDMDGVDRAIDDMWKSFEETMRQSEEQTKQAWARSMGGSHWSKLQFQVVTEPDSPLRDLLGVEDMLYGELIDRLKESAKTIRAIEEEGGSDRSPKELQDHQQALIKLGEEIVQRVDVSNQKNKRGKEAFTELAKNVRTDIEKLGREPIEGGQNLEILEHITANKQGLKRYIESTLRGDPQAHCDSSVERDLEDIQSTLKRVQNSQDVDITRSGGQDNATLKMSIRQKENELMRIMLAYMQALATLTQIRAQARQLEYTTLKKNKAIEQNLKRVN